MCKFELALHGQNPADLLCRHAASNVSGRKPETFDFRLHALLHAITQMGHLRHWGKTIKRMRAKLLAIKMRCARNARPTARTGAWMKQMLQGHLNYFAVRAMIRASGGT
jgi:hypothetical protein